MLLTLTDVQHPAWESLVLQWLPVYRDKTINTVDLVRDFSGLGWVGGLSASNINRCSTSSLGIFGTTVVTCV